MCNGLPTSCDNEGVSTDRVESPSAADSTPPEHYWHVPRLLIAWLLTLFAALLVSVLFSWQHGRMEWFAVVIAGGTLATFGLQLGTAQRQGFIARTALSVGGAVFVVILVAAITYFTGL